MRGRGCWLVAFLPAMFVLLPAAATVSHPIKADVRIEEPASLNGQLSASNITTALWTPVQPGSDALPLLESPRARLTVLERRSTLGVHAAIPKFAVYKGPQQPNEDLLSLNVTIASLEPASSWMARVTQGSFVFAGRCGLLPEPWTHPQRFHGFEVSDNASWTLRAECQGPTLQLAGRFDAFVWNSTLDLTYRSSQDGARHSERLRTGEWDESNRTVPGLTDHVVRVARITTLDPDARGTWPGEGPLTLRAPALAFAGAMSLPPFEGALRWDETHRDESAEATRTDGAFVFHSGPDRLAFEGGTWEGPGGMPPTGVAAGAFPIHVALVAAALAAAGWAAWGLFVLYARLARDRLLDHPARRLLYEAVAARPGVSLYELRTVLGRSRSAASHHLRLLVQGGLVVRRRQNRRTIFYRPSDVGRVPGPGTAKRSRWESATLEALRNRPARSQAELASRLGISQGFVSRILGRLRARGQVQRVREEWRTTGAVEGPAEPSGSAEAKPTARRVRPTSSS